MDRDDHAAGKFKNHYQATDVMRTDGLLLNKRRSLMFISRTWHGAVPHEHGDAFAIYLENTGIQESRSIPGNAAAYLHRVDQDGCSHFFLCTLWSSWEAVRAFAGETPEIAVTYPEDAKYGLVSDPIVIHQEVNSGQCPFTGSSLTAFTA